MTILLCLLTFDFASVVSHYIATYDTHSFLLPYISQLACFSAFITNDEHFGTQMKKCLLNYLL